MKMVIDIDDNLYTRLFDNSIDDYDNAADMAKAIRKGIVLLKGYGRLFILDEEKVKKYFTKFSFSLQDWISEVDISKATIKVIEADKEDKNVRNI